MKKHLRRFLCFFLCFCLCFAYFGETQKAEAAGVGLVGIVLMYLLGCGFGFSVSGASTHLAEGITELTKEFIDHGQENIWEAIEAGVTVTEAGVLLFDKVATDALNSFMNWLQTDKGWTEGETMEYDSGIIYELPYVIVKSDGSSIEGVLSSVAPTFFTYEDLLCPKTTSFTSGTIFCAGSDVGYYFCTSGSDADMKIQQNRYRKSDSDIYRKQVGLNLYDCLENNGFTINDLIGFNVYLSRLSDSQFTFRLKPVVSNDGVDIDFYTCNTYSGAEYIDRISSFDSLYSVSVPPDLTAPDTSDWDAATSLGLFIGHSGKIPSSVEEYNDLVLQDINSGVIPEVTTDVIVGTPDQVLPDEDDGTLAGTVSGILAQVKALPQTLANLVLDGVKSIFIPDPSGLETEFMGVLDEVNEKYSFDFDLGSLFGQGVEPEDIKAVYHVGGKDIEMTFVSWYYLKAAVIVFRPYIRGFIVLMLLYYNLRQFMAIFGLGGVMNGDSGDNRRNDLAV